METVIVSLVIITLILFGILTLAQRFLSAQDSIIESVREMEDRLRDQARSDLSPVTAETKPGGATVEIVLRNDGDTKLADFERWDVILQYRGSDGQAYTTWYPYGLGQNEWSVYDIYLDAPDTQEVFEPDILNPGEEIAIHIWVSPPVAAATTNLATAATPNGITATTVFTH